MILSFVAGGSASMFLAFRALKGTSWGSKWMQICGINFSIALPALRRILCIGTVPERGAIHYFL